MQQQVPVSDVDAAVDAVGGPLPMQASQKGGGTCAKSQVRRDACGQSFELLAESLTMVRSRSCTAAVVQASFTASGTFVPVATKLSAVRYGSATANLHMRVLGTGLPVSAISRITGGVVYC